MGRWRLYGLAFLYPVIVLSLTALVAWLSGAIVVEKIRWGDALQRSALMILFSIPLTIITEDGFFRGWLWASLQRASQNKHGAIVWTSLAFAAWHLSIAMIDTGFSVSPAQVPVYIFNVFAGGGVILALVRLISGSVIVASSSHALWNGIGYVFLGSGASTGVLGIQDSNIYGLEVGIVGVVLNLVFAVALWLWYRHSEINAAATTGVVALPVSQAADLPWKSCR